MSDGGLPGYLDEELIDFIPTITIEEDPLAIKVEVFNNEINNAEVLAIPQLTVDKVDDDVVMYYEDKNSFMSCRSHLQLKQSDPFSGNWPYDIGVS